MCACRPNVCRLAEPQPLGIHDRRIAVRGKGASPAAAWAASNFGLLDADGPGGGRHGRGGTQIRFIGGMRNIDACLARASDHGLRPDRR
jgi:hypothetical protein